MGIFKKGENYYIDYYVNGKRKREMIGPNKSLAKKALDARRGEIVRGKYKLPKKKERILFEDFAKIYLDYVKGYKKSARSDGTSIRNMMSFFKGSKLNMIHPFSIETYKIKRKKQVKPASVNRELACLKHMFNMAIKWGYAEANPMREVKLFREDNERLRYLSAKEEAALIESCAPHLKPIMIFALNTGMRKGEIFHLRWKFVDLKNRLIRVEKTKNNETRIIPMNKLVYDVLMEQKRLRRSEYVFPNRQGKPYDNVKRSFSSALKRAGIHDFRFHDLRHSFASNLVMQGVDIITVKELLGHKSIKMTMRYSHLSQRHKMKAVEKLEDREDIKYGHYLDTEKKLRVNK